MLLLRPLDLLLDYLLPLTHLIAAACPESAYIASASVHEMLMSSDPDGKPAARAFPAVSAAWPDASFYRLRNMDGSLISAQRLGGATTFVQVESTGDADVEFTLSVADWAKAAMPAVLPASVAVRRSNGGFAFTMRAKGAVVLYLKERASPPFVIRAAPSEAAEENFLGYRTPVTPMVLQCVIK